MKETCLDSTRTCIYIYIYLTRYYNELNIENSARIIYPSWKKSKIIRFFRMTRILFKIKTIDYSPYLLRNPVTALLPEFRQPDASTTILPFAISQTTYPDRYAIVQPDDFTASLPQAGGASPRGEALMNRYRPISRFERGRVINIHETVPSRNIPTTSRDASL